MLKTQKTNKESIKLQWNCDIDEATKKKEHWNYEGKSFLLSRKFKNVNS